jgi:hypothetical protein
MLSRSLDYDISFISLGNLYAHVDVREGNETSFDPHRTVLLFFTETEKRNNYLLTLGYGLDDRGSRVRFPAGAGNFSLHHRIHNGSGSHPASYPMRKRGCLTGDKAAGA